MDKVTIKLFLRDVTQFGSVSALGAESRRFESCHPELFEEEKMVSFRVSKEKEKVFSVQKYLQDSF